MHSVNLRSGQIGIAVMLMMVVMSTVGFALAIRASRDVQTARQGQDAVQTFSAAEAIVEKVLAQGEVGLETASTGTVSDIQNIEGSYTVTVSQNQTLELDQGVIVEVPLAAPGQSVGNMNGNQVAIEWAKPGSTGNCTQNPASLIVTVVNNAGPTPVARTVASAGCSRSDNIPVSNTATTQLGRRIVVNLVTGDSVIRITPLYNSTPLFVTGANWTLPTQQYLIRSVARNTLGRETKAIQVDRTRDFAPSVLNYSLVSGTTLVK